MKPLTLKETALKEEMKERCLAKGQYIDENAKAKFEMLCHLEDFEVQYWELQEENKKLNGAIQTYDILLKSNVEENKQLKEKINLRNREKTDICNRIHNQKEKSKRHKKEITDLIAKNQALKIQISAREEVCNRLESNWNKLKEWLKTNIDKPNIKFILETMQELEQEGDSNEENKN